MVAVGSCSQVHYDGIHCQVNHQATNPPCIVSSAIIEKSEMTATMDNMVVNVNLDHLHMYVLPKWIIFIILAVFD